MLVPLISSRLLRHDKKFERQVRMQGRTLLQQMSDKILPHPFTEEGISAALQKTKPASAPGMWNSCRTWAPKLAPGWQWLSKFFSRIMATHSIPKIWRKAKVIAVEKNGKDPSLAANYPPISCWVCVTSSWSVLHSSAFLPQSTPRFTQSRPGWLPERSKHVWPGCCPHHFHRKLISAEPKDWHRVSRLNSSIYQAHWPFLQTE